MNKLGTQWKVNKYCAVDFKYYLIRGGSYAEDQHSAFFLIYVFWGVKDWLDKYKFMCAMNMKLKCLF